MKQEINLYQEQFHEIKKPLSAKKMLLVTASFLLAVGIGSVSLVSVNNYYDKKYADLAHQVKNVKLANEKLRLQVESRYVDENLIRRVDDTELKMRARQNILRLVDEAKVDNEQMFSSLLEGLGRQYLSGMWLSYIEIYSRGQELNLRGSTVNPKLITKFLSNLNDEKAFSGREFKKVVLKRNKDNIEIVDFELTTDIVVNDMLFSFNG